jgi:CxxC motif-containing protein (DUF1111 family)
MENNGGRADLLSDIDASLPAKRASQLQLRELIAQTGKEDMRLQMANEISISQRNTPALFGANLINNIPERVILAEAKKQRLKFRTSRPEAQDLPVGRAIRLANGRIGRFGWKAQTASLSDFVRAACANELGLGNPGQNQPVALYNEGETRPMVLDLSAKQCDELTAFCASLPKPVEKLPKGVTADQAAEGKKLFSKIGCAECHTPKLGSVDGIYSDLLVHNMGSALVGGGSYNDPFPTPVPTPEGEGPMPSEWRTPPLWGVADSAPYMHDGRADTLEEAIALHGGQGKRSADKFAALGAGKQAQLIAFLRTLQAP